MPNSLIETWARFSQTNVAMLVAEDSFKTAHLIWQQAGRKRNAQLFAEHETYRSLIEAGKDEKLDAILVRSIDKMDTDTQLRFAGEFSRLMVYERGKFIFTYTDHAKIQYALASQFCRLKVPEEKAKVVPFKKRQTIFERKGL